MIKNGEIKKEYKTRPTAKQRKAFDKLIENDGNKGKALEAAGYSKSLVDNPHRVMESKGWQQLIEEHLGDEKLAQVHAEGLTLKHTNPLRHKYLETAYKLKGSFAPEKSVNLNVNTTVNKEADKIAQKYEEELRNEIINLEDT